MKYAKLLLSSILVFVLISCAGTYVPKADAVSEQASYDGNEKTSGILGVSDSGFIVTDRFLVRYDALVEKYSDKFTPSLKKRFGVTGNTMSREAMAYFLTMNRWNKNGISVK